VINACEAMANVLPRSEVANRHPHQPDDLRVELNVQDVDAALRPEISNEFSSPS